MIIGIVFCGIIAMIIILLVASRGGKSTITEQKREFTPPPQRKFPIIYAKDCRFFANDESRFEYSDKEIEQFMDSLEECFSCKDYIKTINMCVELIKVMPKQDSVWVKKVIATFGNIIENEGCWNDKLSKSIVNACYGFLQCFDTVIDRSNATKQILVPVLLKKISELIKYQNRNVTKYHNFEVYNMLLNIYYVLPYKEFLVLLTEFVLQDKVEKEFGDEPYVKQTLKNLVKCADILRTNNTSKLQENFNSRKITNCTLIVDDRVSAIIVAFELTFEPGEKEISIEASFFDESGKEVQLGKEIQEKLIEKFEIKTDKGTTTKQEIVVLTDEKINKVELKVLEKEKKINIDENLNKEDNTLNVSESRDGETNSEEIEGEVEAEQNDNKKDQMLMYPSFREIEDIGISDTQFIGLSKNKTVISLGIGDNLKEQIVAWSNVKRVYVKDDEMFCIRNDGTVAYAGKCKYDRCEYIYSWENVEELFLGDRHLVAITNNSTLYSVGADSNGECDVEEWYDIIQVSVAYHTVGLCKDGRVKATGENNFGECDVASWRDIVQVATGDFYTLGLTSSGRVLSAGLNSCGQCNVSEWTNIKKIFARGNMSVGLRYDGKVVTAGKNSYYYGDIKKWSRIKDVTLSNNRIIGIEQDGAVKIAGKPCKNFISSNWMDVKKVVINSEDVVGLKEDGTLISNNMIFGCCVFGNANEFSQICEDKDNKRIAILSSQGVLTVSDKLHNTTTGDTYPSFYDVKKAEISGYCLAMLKNDGTVESFKFSDGITEKIENWENIIDIGVGNGFIVGLDISGKVKTFGEFKFEEYNLSDWNDIVKIQVAGDRVMGLSIDGKLFMVGSSEFGEDDFAKIEKNIKDFALTKIQTMVLENDGTVKVTYHPDGVDTQVVKSWSKIKKIVRRGENFLGLTEDGKVYSTIDNEVEVSEWEDIEDIQASDGYVWAIMKK